MDLVVSLNYCSQNGGNLCRARIIMEPKYRTPYYREFRPIPIWGFRLRVSGGGFRVEGLGFRVEGLGLSDGSYQEQANKLCEVDGILNRYRHRAKP